MYDRTYKEPLDPNKKYDVISVNKKPYLFTKNHVRFETKPKGFWMYELADGGDDQGRPNRAATKILTIDFAGTIFGRNMLPLGTDKQYYIQRDEFYDVERESYYIDLVKNEVPEDIFQRMMEGFDKNNPREDEFFYLNEKATIQEYIDNYSKFAKMADEEEYFTFDEITSEEQIDEYFELPFMNGNFYFLGPDVYWDVECLENFTADELKEAYQRGAQLTYISGPALSREEALQIRKEVMQERRWKEEVLKKEDDLDYGFNN